MFTDSELDEIGEEKVRNRLNRGDFCDPSEVLVVKRWLSHKDKERDFISRCERASLSSALNANNNARTANKIAIIAALFALLANVLAVMALLKT
jgi:hypothetical protein